MKFIDYYEVLQVSPTASFEVIKSSYRQLSKMYHPDTSKHEDRKFILITEAYDILSDKYKRYEYDKIWIENQNTNKFNNRTEETIIPPKEFSKSNTKTSIKTWTLLISFLFLGGLVLGELFSYYDDSYIDAEVAEVSDTSNRYDISLPKEDYSRVKTTEHILNYGEAYFDIYNGTNLTIDSIKIEINVKNDKGDIIDTRQFIKEVYIPPFATKKEINITTGIEDLPAVSENDSHVQPEYISWSYIYIKGEY